MLKVLEEMRRRVTIGGTIRTSNGDESCGVAVTATPGERKRRKSAAGFVATGPSTRTVSKGNGCFGFIDLPPGFYRVSARCDAWSPDRLVSLEGHDDIEIAALDPGATPQSPPPHLEIVLAVRAPDVEVGSRTSQKEPPPVPARIDRAGPGMRVIEFG